LVAVLASAEVVDCHALVENFFEGSVAVFVVELGRPVRGLVVSNLAGCAVRLAEGTISCRGAEVGGAGDFMDVAG